MKALLIKLAMESTCFYLIETVYFLFSKTKNQIQNSIQIFRARNKYIILFLYELLAGLNKQKYDNNR